MADVVLRLGESERVNRFSGLQGNPNYFTVDIIMALSGIAILLFRENNRLPYIILFIVLTVIGFLSLSKSFLISWVVLIFFMALYIIKSHKQRVRRLIFIMLATIGLIYFVAAEQINEYIIRFTETIDDMSDFTTGRTDIWRGYITTIWNNLKILFVGNGINGSLVNGRGVHNTYLEAIYSLGILGTSLFLLVLCICFKFNTKISEKVQFLPLIILLIRFLAIGLLAFDNLWFYLVIAVSAIAGKVQEV